MSLLPSLVVGKILFYKLVVFNLVDTVKGFLGLLKAYPCYFPSSQFWSPNFFFINFFLVKFLISTFVKVPYICIGKNEMKYSRVIYNMYVCMCMYIYRERERFGCKSPYLRP